MLNNHIVLFTDNATDKNMKSQSSEQTSIRVTGTVRDTNGEPLVGANISVKNTTIGTITDIDGNYSIDVPDEQSVLLFSMIGFIPQEIKAGDRKNYHLSLYKRIYNYLMKLLSSVTQQSKQKE